MLRGEFATLVIRPKLPAERSLTGAPNTTRLKGFDISVRNCKRRPLGELRVLENAEGFRFEARLARIQEHGGVPECERRRRGESARLRNEFTFGSKLELETRIGSPVRFGRKPPLNTKLFGFVP